MSLQNAIEHHQQGELEKAQSLYNEVLEAEPDNADALHLLGILFSQMLQHKSAIEMINRAIGIRQVPEYYNNLCSVHYHMGAYKEAVVAGEQAIRLNTDFGEAYYNLGNALFQLSDFEKALNAFDRTIKLDPKHIDALYNKANSLLELNREAEARETFEAIVEFEPEHTPSLSKLIPILESLGRVDEARIYYDRLNKITGKLENIPFSRFLNADDREIQSVKIKNDLSIGVPDNVRLMTPYILLEQEDWFEDEIKFVRKLVQPGMKCIDIGANYGIYSLTIAQGIAPDGTIWSFEPTQSLIPYLEWSMEENEIDNMFLIEFALSDHEGEAWFYTDKNTELNMVVMEESEGMESVPLMTVDECMRRYSWEGIDFVKMDAEGQESNIVKGAENFLSRQSPLVLFEIKHGDILNTDLAAQFEELGYESYVLVPGLNILAPFSISTKFDEFLLNIFCCKQDRAMLLSENGLLTDSEPKDVREHIPDIDTGLEYIADLPYSQSHLHSWKEQSSSSDNEYLLALSAYVKAHHAENAVNAHSMLHTSNLLLESSIKSVMSIPRLQTYARVLWELGRRSDCLNVLRQLEEYINDAESTDFFKEPFLPVSQTFELIDPKEEHKSWCLASVLGLMEILQHYSSYFNPEQSLLNISKYSDLGFPNAVMERRRRLISILANPDVGVDSSASLSGLNVSNLNTVYWS